MNAVLTAPATETKPERITSYYREGSSDKVYQAAIEPEGDLFVVNFAFGRQGSTLSTGTKTSSPVDYETAKRIYDKLVREKQSIRQRGQEGGARLVFFDSLIEYLKSCEADWTKEPADLPEDED